MDEVIKTFLLSMAPVGELRFALPVAIGVYKLHWVLAYIITVAGNMVPVFLILVFLGSTSKWLSENSAFFRKFFDRFFERTKKKTEKQVNKYGCLALAIFVAAPLPLTGAWTGAVAAFLFGIPFKKAFPSIFYGVAVAGLIVLILTKTGIWLI